MTLLRALRELLRRGRRDDEIREELAFHLEAQADEARASGLSDAEARRAARRDLGNLALVEETTREAWRWRRLERLAQDVGYAVRMMRRRPGFTIAAILSLTLGIGATVAIFSLLDALMLEQLPVRRPTELVQLIESRVQEGVAYDEEEFVYSAYEQLKSGTAGLSAVATETDSFEGDIVDRGAKHRAVTQLVSANYFDLLGVGAAHGRVFHQPMPEIDHPIAVVSEAYWRRRFAESASVLGATIQRGRISYTVVGVAARGFRGLELESSVDIWLLFDQVVPANDESRKRGRWMRIIGRLADGATPAQVSAQATGILGRTVRFQPGATPYSTLRLQLNRPLRLASLVVVLVLLIACTNLAGLTYAGNLARERELAVRRALGASRRRLIGQLLTESLLLASIGALLALAVAYWTNRALLAFLPPAAAPALTQLRFDLDPRTIAMTALIAIVTAVAIGLFPALYTTQSGMADELRVKTGAGRRSRSWTSRSLIVGEIAACTILLMLAGVLLQSVQNLRGQDAGYVEEQLLVADVAFPSEHGEQRRDLQLEELRTRIAALPGVQVASFSNLGQLSGGAFHWRIGFPDQPFTREQAPQVIEHRVTPGFLAAMGTRLTAGREFTAADTASAPLVAIVNEPFAETFFPGRNPIGQRFYHEGGSRSRQLMEVVGVVQSVRWLSLRAEPRPMYYRPYAQQGGTPMVRFAVRAAGSLDALSAAVTAAAQAIDRDVNVTNVVPFTEIVNRALRTERLVASVSTAFGALGLLIAAIGLYGVLAFNVTRRRREIGVRIAVGASPGTVERMFLRESFAMLVLGLGLGVPLAIAVTRSIAAMLYGIGPQDPVALAAVVVVLGAATAAAAFIPAKRAAAIDPISALREE